MRTIKPAITPGKRIKDNESIKGILNPGSTFRDLSASVQESVKNSAPRPSRKVSMRKF